jgi:hypothetical protein
MLRGMKYFGRRTFSPVYDETIRVETPVGEPCGHCGERIEAGDDGFVLPSYPQKMVAFHRACHLRGVFGCVEHQRKPVCDGTCRDDPKLSVREAAEAAVEYYERAHGLKSLDSLN